MDKKEKWNNFIDTLYLDAIKNFEVSKISDYQNERKAHMEEIIDSNIPRCDKRILSTRIFRLYTAFKINKYICIVVGAPSPLFSLSFPSPQAPLGNI